MLPEYTDEPVICTTEHRGVFVGRVALYSRADRVLLLRDARNVIRFGTVDGLWQLASSGPTDSTKFGALVPRLEITHVTSIAPLTADARRAWGLS